MLAEVPAEDCSRGTKIVLGEGSGDFNLPVSGYSITSTFGMRWGKLHKGIDMGRSTIKAADDGVIELAGREDGLRQLHHH